MLEEKQLMLSDQRSFWIFGHFRLSVLSFTLNSQKVIGSFTFFGDGSIIPEGLSLLHVDIAGLIAFTSWCDK